MEHLETLTEKLYTRREILRLAGIGIALLVPGCATISKEDLAYFKNISVPGAKSMERKGADLEGLFSGVQHPGFGTYDRHILIGEGAAGMDFSIRDDNRICPVASGIVTNVETYPGAGNTITIYHGLYWSYYGHLEEQLARLLQYVTRKDIIGIGGSSGSGGALVPHLHLSIGAVKEVAPLIAARSSPGETIWNWFDPVDFAAHKVFDSHGNLTLPYWYGKEIDGALDEAFNENYESKRRLIDTALKKFPYSEIRDLYENARSQADRKYGINDRNIGKKAWFLYDRIKGGKHPFNEPDARNIMSGIKDFLSFPLLITAPKPNPFMPQLYK